MSKTRARSKSRCRIRNRNKSKSKSKSNSESESKSKSKSNLRRRRPSGSAGGLGNMHLGSRSGPSQGSSGRGAAPKMMSVTVDSCGNIVSQEITLEVMMQLERAMEELAAAPPGSVDGDDCPICRAMRAAGLDTPDFADSHFEGMATHEKAGPSSASARPPLQPPSPSPSPSPSQSLVVDGALLGTSLRGRSAHGETLWEMVLEELALLPQGPWVSPPEGSRSGSRSWRKDSDRRLLANLRREGVFKQRQEEQLEDERKKAG